MNVSASSRAAGLQDREFGNGSVGHGKRFKCYVRTRGFQGQQLSYSHCVTGTDWARSSVHMTPLF